jgi:hypothetical protein
MSLSDPIKPFVEQYVKLVTDADSSEFINVLEMKGIKRVDQNQYLELFKTIAPKSELKSSANNIITNDSQLSTTGRTGMIQGSEESRIKKLERLIKTFK